eukprot:gene9307-12539_t
MYQPLLQEDGQNDNQNNPSIEDSASRISQWLLTYLNPLFKLGQTKELVLEDLGPPSNSDKSRLLYDRFQQHWEKQSAQAKKKGSKPSLWHVMWRTVGYYNLFVCILLFLISSMLSFGPILILSKLVNHFQSTHRLNDLQLWSCIGLMFLFPIFSSITNINSNVIINHIAAQFRNTLIGKVFRKSLVLSPSARAKQSTGMIVNMFANDTKQIQNFLYFFNNLLVAPIQIAVTLYLIYLQVGIATFVGLGYMALNAPLNAVVFSFMTSIRKSKVLETDKRVKLMNEVLAGIRVIKFYAWEVPFMEKINEIRKAEVNYLRKIAYIVAIGFSLFFYATPIILPIIIFFTFVKLGNELDAATAFTTIALFNMLQMPFAFLPMGLVSYAQSQVSVNRLTDYFLSDEIENYVSKSTISNGIAVSISNGNMGWSNDENAQPAERMSSQHSSGRLDSRASKSKSSYSILHQEENKEFDPEAGVIAPPINRAYHTLMDVNVHIKKGQLVAIIGSVGSGKSSLLSAILGEMYLHTGSIEVNGSIAYCDQRAWILNATIEDNILFGSRYDERRFKHALHAANLETDLEVLPAGLKTEIGERGINLSGGQKARVALARAIYLDSDIYILDDPLSAVDAHVGQFLFHDCIKVSLGSKTRLLVTHQVQYLPECDLVIVLENGHVKACDTYANLYELGVDIASMLPVKTEPQVVAVEPHVESHDKAASPKTKKLSDTTNRAEKSSTEPSKSGNSGGLITTEERGTGDVDFSVYKHYLRAGGWYNALAVLIFLILTQVCNLGANFYLTYWGTQTINQKDHGHPMSSGTNLQYLEVFACLSLSGVFLIVLRGLTLAQVQLNASLKLHHDVLSRVMGAPVAFFDVTPIGRIINRFSSDMSTVDEVISQTISQVSNSFFSCLGALAGIAIATNGVFIAVLFPLAWIYNSIQKMFRKTNTAIARIESISRSPIYAQFSEALSGLNTIRAFHDESKFITKLEKAVDANTVALVTQQLAGGWLGIRLDFIGAFVTFFIALLAAVSDKFLNPWAGYNFIPAGYLALGLSYSFTLTQYLKFCVRLLAQMEANMNSVERIKYYSEAVDREGLPDVDYPNPFNGTDLALSSIPGKRDSVAAKKIKADLTAASQIPEDWPSEGVVVGRGLEMRYRDGPLVLKGISFDIGKYEKIGVVGRTGSGKSSLVSALFRIQELASGRIIIDNIDIATVPLKILRARLGMIPQDPVMFSASVRFNLDPFDAHTDDELWSILERVDMRRHVESLPNGLQEEVAE